MNFPNPAYGQQPGYPPVQPQVPQQQFAPAYPGYPQPPAQYPPQQFAPQYGQQFAPQVPAQPAVNGTLDDFYNQPSTGGGPSISWKNKPEGTTYVGTVARDVTNGDVQQQINFQTKQPEFYRDGRPKFVMKVPLRVAPSQEHPDGEAAFYVRGQARDELARAMSEAGVEGAPQGGATIQVTLVQRKPSGQGMNPSNVVQIRYTPPGQQAQIEQHQPQVQQQVPQQVQYQQPPAQAAPPVQYQQPAPQAVPPAQYAQAPAPQAPAFQPPVEQQQFQQPQAPVQGAPVPPPTLDPNQAAILASLTGQQGQPAA